MPKFNNGKMTTSVIFYNRGVPNNFHSYGFLTNVNYEMLKTIARHNKETHRPIFFM